MSVFLDHASGAPLHPAARKALEEALDAFGDPLRLHSEGRKARKLLDAAREGLAADIGAQPDEIVFTSGGTESVALGVVGVARAAGKPGDRIVISAVEHPSVKGATETLAAEGFEVERVGVAADGKLDLDAFVAAVRRPGTVVASVQHSNHEVGTLQPVAEAARLAREAKVWFHCDAAQSVGRVPIDAEALGVDLLSLSGHKFGGPAGSGALFVGRGVPLAGSPRGDIRERHRRAGTENVAAVAGLAAALAAVSGEVPDQAARQWAMTDRLREGLAAMEGVALQGHPTQRLPHIVAFAAEHVDPEVLAMALDDQGFLVGIGSWENGLAYEPSSVFDAMGSAATPSIRISTGRETNDGDVDDLLVSLGGLLSQLRRVDEASSLTFERRSEGDGSAPGGADPGARAN